MIAYTLFSSMLIFIMQLLIASPLHADTKNTGYKYYQSWTNNYNTDYKTFWSYTGSSLSGHDINTFNIWHSNAKFKDISPKISSAYFFKTPWSNQIKIDNEGSLAFVRKFDDKEHHTMIELSVDNQPKSGNFVNYGGYRSMATGIPYEIVMEIKAVNGIWIKTIPWLLVFQGHAIPDLSDENKKYNPPFALVISRGRWQIHIRADSRLSLPDDRKYERFDKIDLGEVIPDKWTKFTIKVIWGSKNYPENKNTALGVWRDDNLFFQEWGKHNFYNNRIPSGENLGPYLMIGAYTPKFGVENGPITIKIRKLILKESIL